MLSVFFVGLGGFVGAALRYLLGLLPWSGDFPLITFLINIVACVIIGMVSEYAFQKVGQFDRNFILFLRVGFCGGFSTLSAMGLETLVLFDKGQAVLGITYATLTFVVCILAVQAGRMMMRALPC